MSSFVSRSVAAARSPAALLGAAVVGLALTGCGRAPGNRTPLHKAAGKISFDGQAPAGALIVLHPAGGSPKESLKPTAQVQPDGTFRLSTYETGDGAPAGDYVVTVSWRRAVQTDEGYLPGPNVLPPKYASPATSDVVVRVREGDNDLEPITLRR
jgi:hypothetical protein